MVLKVIGALVVATLIAIGINWVLGFIANRAADDKSEGNKD